MNASANNLPLKQKMTSSGFTLIELMVTIAVLAIIVSIAAPNISTQLANQRVKSTAAIFENALKEAKVESVIRRQNVTIIYNAAATPKTLTLRANNNDIARYNINNRSSVDQRITPAGVNSIIFRPDKTIANGATVIYTICDSGSNSETPRQVNLSRIGNVNTMKAGNC